MKGTMTETMAQAVFEVLVEACDLMELKGEDEDDETEERPAGLRGLRMAG